MKPILSLDSLKSNIPVHDPEALLADLAWDYTERIRVGEKPDIAEYLKRFSDEESRREFRSLVAMSALADHVCGRIRMNQ